MQRIIITPSQIAGQSVCLTHDQIHYLCRVLRLEGGDRFIAMDGHGQGWIAALGDGLEQAEIMEPWSANTELSIPICLVMAMPKMGMDDIVRQSTELGVASIYPVVSDRTLLKPSAKKVERWRRIAQEATEQCERQWVPTVYDPMRGEEGLAFASRSFPESKLVLCQERNEGEIPTGFPPQNKTDAVLDGSVNRRWICVARLPQPGQRQPTAGTSIMADPAKPLLSAMIDAVGQGDRNGRVASITLAIGPEGGWTTAEVEGAIALGYEPVSLGPQILRAVTAPVAAMAIVAAVIEGRKI